MNSSPLRSAILQPLSPERAAGTQQVEKISVSSGSTSSVVLNANLWAVALGSKLSARLPWRHSVLSRLEIDAKTFRLSVIGSPLRARRRGDGAHASKMFWVV